MPALWRAVVAYFRTYFQSSEPVFNLPPMAKDPLSLSELLQAQRGNPQLAQRFLLYQLKQFVQAHYPRWFTEETTLKWLGERLCVLTAQHLLYYELSRQKTQILQTVNRFLATQKRPALDQVEIWVK